MSLLAKKKKFFLPRNFCEKDELEQGGKPENPEKNPAFRLKSTIGRVKHGSQWWGLQMTTLRQPDCWSAHAYSFSGSFSGRCRVMHSEVPSCLDAILLGQLKICWHFPLLVIWFSSDWLQYMYMNREKCLFAYLTWISLANLTGSLYLILK